MTRDGSLSTVFVLALLAGATPARSDQIALVATQDNTIYAESDSTFGKGQCLQVGVSGFFIGVPTHARRALLQFDLSGVPAGSQIVSARLKLTQTGGIADPQPFVFLHRLTQAWGEGTTRFPSPPPCTPNGAPADGEWPTAGSATWNFAFYGGDPWSAPGGAFDATIGASAQGVRPVNPMTLEGEGLLADVQRWIAHPEENHGWILVGDESHSATGLRFASREATSPASRPTLTIDFTVPQGACCLSNGECQIATAEGCRTQGGYYRGDNSVCESQVCLTPYVDSLPVPAIAVPIRGRAGGAAWYEIAMKEFKQKLHRDLPPTTLWGYDGRYPGPTILATKNEPVHVRWINDLRDEFGVPRTQHYFDVDTRIHGPDALGKTPRTVVHLHGAHVPPESDGYPESTFVSGESRLYEYPNTQRGTMLWYHDHALGITRYNVIMGLAGIYLLRDKNEERLALPRDQYEIPLLVQDRSFNSDGSLSYPKDWSQNGFMGNKVLVNGKIWPYLSVDRGKYRFRIVNGSNHRIFHFALSDGQAFHVIGSDGGLLREPVALTRLVLGPAERADVVIDFASYAPGSEVLFENQDPNLTSDDAETRQVMKFKIGQRPGWTAPLPQALSDIEPMAEGEAVRTRSFRLKMNPDPRTEFKFRFGDQGWDEKTEYPVLGTSEIWSFGNSTTDTHPIHIHLIQFQILDRFTSFTTIGDSLVPAGERIPPSPEETGWKDTAKLPPGQMMRVIMRFGPAGFLGDYVFHCHMLEHEDNDMMRQFTVVPPAQGGPRTEAATAQPARLWPPDLAMVPVNITGVTDSAGFAVSIHVTGVTQDEPISHRAGPAPSVERPMTHEGMPSAGQAEGQMEMDSVDDPCVDARVSGGQLYLRRERQEGGNGRVYRVRYAAVSRDGGVAEGSVLVTVPREQGVRLAVNDGLRYDSQEGCLVQDAAPMSMSAHAAPAARQASPTELGFSRIEGSFAVVDYSLAIGSEVSIAVFDVSGRRVANLNDMVVEPGPHRASLRIGRLPRGVYFVRMRAAGKEYVRRLLRTEAMHG
jgi:spore coat protein A